MGRGGQRIQVVPALNIIIVTTGCGFDIDDIMPFLIPALVDPVSYTHLDVYKRQL